MEWIILEALVALAIGLAIVWWTMSPARKRDRDAESRPDAQDDAAEGQRK
jgi:hypothetical protein